MKVTLSHSIQVILFSLSADYSNSSIQVKFIIRNPPNINVTVKELHQIESYGNFRVEPQNSDSRKCSTRVLGRPSLPSSVISSIAPAIPAQSAQITCSIIMSQSSSGSSSVYSKSALSPISSFEDVNLFVCNDTAGQQSTIPIIIIPKNQPELYEFEGSDFIVMEDSMRQQDTSGNLRPPTQQEVRQLRQERISWVQQEPRLRWSLDTLERGEAIEMENTQSGGGRRLLEGLRRFEWFRWTLVIWLGWFFGTIRDRLR